MREHLLATSGTLLLSPTPPSIWPAAPHDEYLVLGMINSGQAKDPGYREKSLVNLSGVTDVAQKGSSAPRPAGSEGAAGDKAFDLNHPVAELVSGDVRTGSAPLHVRVNVLVADDPCRTVREDNMIRICVRVREAWGRSILEGHGIRVRVGDVEDGTATRGMCLFDGLINGGALGDHIEVNTF
jgi:hypothetical protein